MPPRGGSPIFERFTDRARRIIVLAQEEARLLDHNIIGTEHILLGMIHEGEGIAAKALAGMGVGLQEVREKSGRIDGGSPSGHIPFTTNGKALLEASLREALQLGHNYIGTEHILLAVVRLKDSRAAWILEELGHDLADVRRRVITLLTGYQDVKGAFVKPTQGFSVVEDDGVLRFRGELPVEDLVAICNDYLLGLHCTLWGEGFDVISTRSRDRAARFLADSFVEALT